MPRNKGTLRNFNDLDVIEERNKRLASWVWKKLDGRDTEKIRPICNEINFVAQDAISQKLLEYLHTKLQPVQPVITRADILKAVTSCHEEAFGWLQHTYYEARD